MEELSRILDRVEARIAGAREKYREKLIEATKPVTATTSPSSSVRTGFGRFLGRRGGSELPTPTKAPSSTVPSSVVEDEDKPAPPAPEPQSKSKRQETQVADFIPFPDHVEFVEDLRRAAELCVIGENYVANVERRHEQKEQREKERWRAIRDGDAGFGDDDSTSHTANGAETDDLL
jgi:hypothetical protein